MSTLMTYSLQTMPRHSPRARQTCRCGGVRCPCRTGVCATTAGMDCSGLPASTPSGRAPCHPARMQDLTSALKINIRSINTDQEPPRATASVRYLLLAPMHRLRILGARNRVGNGQPLCWHCDGRIRSHQHDSFQCLARPAGGRGGWHCGRHGVACVRRCQPPGPAAARLDHCQCRRPHGGAHGTAHRPAPPIRDQHGRQWRAAGLCNERVKCAPNRGSEIWGGATPTARFGAFYVPYISSTSVSLCD